MGGSKSLTEHQLKRIRRARSADIRRIVDQDRYWTPQALRALLQRIEKLNQEDPVDALASAESTLVLVKRIRETSPDLEALALAVNGSSLRHNGRLSDALDTYSRALSIKNLSSAGRGDVLARMAVTLVALGRLSESLLTINEALHLMADPVPGLAVRALVYQDLGFLSEALDDCLEIMDLVKEQPARTDYSLLSAIATSCNVLSYEIRLPNEGQGLLDRLENVIEEYRALYPSKGSSFYKAQRPRLMLSRARALIMMRTDRNHQAIVPLQRAARGLAKDYPDDALAATMDLVCAYAQCGLSKKAAIAARKAPALLERARFGLRQPLAAQALKMALEKNEIQYGEAVELRLLARPQNLKQESKS